MDCKLASKHLWTYLDGELSPDQVLDLEAHIEGCGPCADDRDFALRTKASVRAALQPVGAPDALRRRVQDALDHAQTERQRVVDIRLQRGLTAGLLAAAAAVLIGVFGGYGDERSTGLLGGSSQAAAPMAAPGLFREVVAGHTDHLPTEVETSEPEQVSVWFRDKLGFRVPTVRFREPEVRLLGARVSNVGDRRAARLYYSVGQRRLTAHAFEATPDVRRMLDASDTLQRAHVGQQEISYHTINGYTVPVLERGGVVYAFTGDLDGDSLLRLVASAEF